MLQVTSWYKYCCMSKLQISEEKHDVRCTLVFCRETNHGMATYLRPLIDACNDLYTNGR